MDAMPPDALPSCFKPQATVVSASVISPASTPSCLSAASSIDNLAGPLTELAAAAATGTSGVADGATGTDRKEGESKFVVAVLISNTGQFIKSGQAEKNGHRRDWGASVKNYVLLNLLGFFIFLFCLFVFPIVAMLDMNISQFLKSLGLEHLRDIFEREQVSNCFFYQAHTLC